MCGISGILTYKGFQPLGNSYIKKMTKELIHRGPDDEGFYFDNTIHLGFRRLKIIDLEHGNQPMSNEKNTIVMIFNGEIYNFKSLRTVLIGKG